MPEKKIINSIEEWDKQKTNTFNRDAVKPMNTYETTEKNTFRNIKVTEFKHAISLPDAELIACANRFLKNAANNAQNKEAINQVFNIAVGDRTTLKELYEQIKQNLNSSYPNLKHLKPIFRDYRAGDVRHSLASIDKARVKLGYNPTQNLGDGLRLAMTWYKNEIL